MYPYEIVWHVYSWLLSTKRRRLHCIKHLVINLSLFVYQSHLEKWSSGAVNVCALPSSRISRHYSSRFFNALTLCTGICFGLLIRVTGMRLEATGLSRSLACITSTHTATSRSSVARTADTCASTSSCRLRSTFSAKHSGARLHTFWCLFHWWRVGTRPSRSTRSTYCGSRLFWAAILSQPQAVLAINISSRGRPTSVQSIYLSSVWVWERQRSAHCFYWFKNASATAVPALSFAVRQDILCLWVHWKRFSKRYAQILWKVGSCRLRNPYSRVTFWQTNPTANPGSVRVWSGPESHAAV